MVHRQYAYDLFLNSLGDSYPIGVGSPNIFYNTYAYHDILLLHILVDIMHLVTISIMGTFIHLHNNIIKSLYSSNHKYNIMHRTTTHYDINITHSFFSYITMIFIKYNNHVYSCFNPTKLLLILLQRQDNYL